MGRQEKDNSIRISNMVHAAKITAANTGVIQR